MSRPTVTLAPVRPILRVEDICDLLRISATTFYELKKQEWFGRHGPALIEVEPPLDRHPRYRGDPFAAWLQEDRQARLIRQQLRAAK